jgi:hypothetical protein
MQEALPPELRAVYEPLAHKLANVLRSDALVPTMRRLLALLGSSLSHLATEVMLKPRGRRQLRRGLLAFAETCPASLRPLLYTLADPTLCLLGLRGTQLLCDAMRLESGVRAERLFELEGEIGAASDRPPRRVEHPEVGQMVRVLIAEAAAHPQPGCSAGLFRARIHAEEPPSHSGMAPTYVIEYVDEVALVAGNSCVGAEYHIFDYIPELRCHWLLWLRGLQVDLKMPVLGSSKSPTDASASLVRARRAASQRARRCTCVAACRRCVMTRSLSSRCILSIPSYQSFKKGTWDQRTTRWCRCSLATCSMSRNSSCSTHESNIQRCRFHVCSSSPTRWPCPGAATTEMSLMPSLSSSMAK